MKADTLAAVEALIKRADAKVLSVGGVEYTTAQVFRPVHPAPRPTPVPVALEFKKLASLATYLEENRDGLALASLMVVVDSPWQVTLCGPLVGEGLVRLAYARVAHEEPINHAEFEEPQTVEDTLIHLQTGFVDTPTRSGLLLALGSISDENVHTAEDDGVSQIVTARTSVVLKGAARIPNPIMLRPYRTFREITQPESLFVVRLVRGGGSLPTVRLLPADGSTWEGAAVDQICDWLEEKLPDAVAVLG